MVAPSCLVRLLIEQAHGLTHVGKLSTYKAVREKWWCPYLKEKIDNFCAECETCGKYNNKKIVPHPLLKFPVPEAPWKEIYIDFTDMGMAQRVRGYRYLLVAVDRFKWVEAIPTRNEDAATVVNWLTKEWVLSKNFLTLFISGSASNCRRISCYSALCI